MMQTIESSEVEREARAWTAERKFASTPFGEVAYVDRGAGREALFLHGFPLHSFQWRGVVEQLKNIRRCIAPDLLGLGFTKVRPGQQVAPSDQANMIAAFLDVLGIRAVDLIANDSGTGVAQIFLARFPHKVRTLLLTNGEVETDAPPAPLAPIIQLGKDGLFADAILVPSLRDKAVMRGENGIATLTYGDPSSLSDFLAEYYFRVLVDTDVRKALANAYVAAFDPNPLAGLEAVLRRSATSVRIVWGTGDVIFSPRSPDYLDNLFPNSRGVRRLDRARTFFPEEWPGVVAEEARALWGA